MKKFKFLIIAIFSMVLSLSASTICYADEVDQSTTLLLHMNNDIIKDECGHKITNNGVSIDLTDKKLGDGSGKFTGTGSHLLIPDCPDLNMGTGDFTFDLFIKYNGIRNGSYNNYPTIFKNQPKSCWGPGDICFHVNTLDNPNKYVFTLNGIGAFISNSNIKYGVWQHVAVVRHNGLCMMFIDGVLDATWSYSGKIDLGYNGGMVIGGKNAENVCWFGGNIDELRISNIARWTENFIPPTAPVSATTLVLNKTSLNMTLNDTFSLVATITPESTSNKNINWTSNNPEVASVDLKTGLVTALKYGTASITASTQDGSNLSAKCTIAVTKANTSDDNNGNATLTITMSNGNIKSYNVSMKVINKFIEWYEDRASGSNGNAYFKFDKTRIEDSIKTEYIVFDKISSFQIEQNK